MDELFLREVYPRPWYPNLDPKYENDTAVKNFPGKLYLDDLNSKIVNGIRIRQVRVKQGRHQVYIAGLRWNIFFSDLFVCLFACLFVCTSKFLNETKFYCLMHKISNNTIENNCKTLIDSLEFLTNHCWFSNVNENNFIYLFLAIREEGEWNRFYFDMFSFVQYVIVVGNAEKKKCSIRFFVVQETQLLGLAQFTYVVFAYLLKILNITLHTRIWH